MKPFGSTFSVPHARPASVRREVDYHGRCLPVRRLLYRLLVAQVTRLSTNHPSIRARLGRLGENGR